MRTGNINVQAVLAQAQAKLSGTTQQTPSSNGTSEAEKIGKLYPPLAGVHQRIAAQSQTASASLSALGQFKSGLFNLGTAAKNLAALPAASTPQAIQTSLEQVVSAYNATLKSGAAMSGAGSDAGAGISGAQRELRAAVDGAATSAGALAKLGVVRKPDGTLSLDTAALSKALTSDRDGAVAALTGMAKSMSGIASKTLADDSRLSTSLARLDSRAQALKAQQAAVLSTATELAELSSSGTSWSAMALAAYRRV